MVAHEPVIPVHDLSDSRNFSPQFLINIGFCMMLSSIDPIISFSFDASQTRSDQAIITLFPASTVLFPIFV